MSADTVNVKVHVHRADLHDPSKPRKWWLHFGEQKAAFVDCVITAPMRTAIDLERGDTGDKLTACAQAWLEADVPAGEISFSGDGTVAYIGPAAAAAS